MMFLKPVLAATFLLSISSNSFAGHLFDVLQRMTDADQQQNYQGTFILRKSDNLSTLRVTHGNDDKGVWESMEALNGELRKIVRRDNKVVSVFPERELVTIRSNAKKQPLHWQLPENIKQLESSYSIKQLADDRIAGHPTLVVDLIPNDELRYGYRYWIDKNTGMLLRCDLVTEDNEVVEQMMFTSLDYLPQPPQPPFDLRQFQHYEQLLLDEAEVDAEHSAPWQWVVNELPQGFRLTQSAMRYSQLSDAKNADDQQQDDQHQHKPDLLHLVYSDGLASVSVFVEKNEGIEKHLNGVSSMGAVNAFGTPVGDYFVTVVGEVPVATVRLMAQSTVPLQ